ncbi:transcriptional repressor NrdR [Thermosulfurimonas marina]|uniref:Transcriptional repressor NrdR n=1 Tax=Thermosulfurimonas marina TaxID=2047767 RepID=A0A6H1WQS9_9BACT|nr:transcriptional regulator NrdR [Thermosulfurimonas marina]QJA05543.1 transcriptional repressor NrdR [Thermosulfurimonas marina]
MRCPSCQKEDTKVVDSRSTGEGFVIRRRRECPHCGFRFTTYERLELTLPYVIKKDGRREPFSREKLISGIRKACHKRPVSQEEIENFVSQLERELFESGEKEIPSSYLGERVMEKLREWDEVAYVRFASVYREFQDVNEFVEQVAQLLRGRRRGNRSRK